MSFKYWLITVLSTAILVDSSNYWMIAYYTDPSCTVLEHTNAFVLDTCLSYQGLQTGIKRSYMWTFYHNFGDNVEIRRNEYEGNTICQGTTASTTTGYTSYTVCSQVVGTTNAWYITTFTSDPVLSQSGSAILSYRNGDYSCANLITQAKWYPANCITYLEEGTRKALSIQVGCSGAGIVTFNKFSTGGCGTFSKSETIVYPTCTPNPNLANINDPSAQYVVSKCTIAAAPAPAPCFSASETVQLVNGETRLIRHLQVGDRVLAADASGKIVHSDVVYLPHSENQYTTTFQKLVLTSGRSIQLTPDHLIFAAAACSGCDDRSNKSCSIDDITMDLLRADEVSPGMCLQTVDGFETVSDTRLVHGEGLYTLVTTAPYVLVNGVVASPFSVNHALLDSYYNVHRVLYYLLPRSVYNGAWVQRTNEHFGIIMINLSQMSNHAFNQLHYLYGTLKTSSHVEINSMNISLSLPFRSHTLTPTFH